MLFGVYRFYGYFVKKVKLKNFEVFITVSFSHNYEITWVFRSSLGLQLGTKNTNYGSLVEKIYQI